jgi:protoporphyrinogen oxidase
MSISRRAFVVGGVAGAIGIAGAWKYKQSISNKVPGQIVGASHHIGHLLRQASQSKPTSVGRVRCCIVGGGISGLSAAWQFTRKGFDDFQILELETKVGGNSTYGENQISAYPWGAHYLPLPNQESVLVKELLEELDVIKGYNTENLPIYEETAICHAPVERLYIHGKWQESLVPSLSVPDSERQEIEEFHRRMDYFSELEGGDGKKVFAIPMLEGSNNPQYLRLDEITFSDWLKNENFTSKYLLWYLNYSCRDDYGVGIEGVSAWAGIHYFASRRGKAANADYNTMLTWPEGNGWIVKKLEEKLSSKIKARALVTNIESNGNIINVDYYDVSKNELFRLQSDFVIYAAPRFTSAYLIDEYKKARPSYLNQFDYSPWMVANLSIRLPLKNSPQGLFWDNVSFYSKSLGYVFANHQDMKLSNGLGVITYYLPLDNLPSKQEREAAINKNFNQWADEILQDLSHVHSDIYDKVVNMDIWLWGHGMIRPKPGLISSMFKGEIPDRVGNIFFAHSDQSGISIFEEAQYRGVSAAKKILGIL